MDAVQAMRAHRQPRDIQQGLAADAAIGRKENAEETLGDWTGPSSGGQNLRNNGMPYYSNTGMARPDSVLTTAEDGLLDPAANPPRPIFAATPAV